MNWQFWTAGTNAALILTAALIAFLRPPHGTDRRTVRLVAGFLMGFASAILLGNIGQLAISYGLVKHFTPFAFVSDLVGLLGDASLLVLALRPVPPQEWRPWLPRLLFIAAPALAVLGLASGFEGVVANLYLVILPLTAGLIFLRRLMQASREGNPQARPLALMCCAFLGYAIFRGTDIWLNIDTQWTGLGPWADLASGILTAVYATLAFLFGGFPRHGTRRPIPLSWLLPAAGLGIATATLNVFFADLYAFWASFTRLAVGAFIIAALRVQTLAEPNTSNANGAGAQSHA
jgi:hypothetical protein